MKIAYTTLLALVCAAAGAQTQTPEQVREARIQSAFATLRDQGDLLFHLTGTQTYNGRTTNLEGYAYYKVTLNGTREVLQYELRQLRDGALVQRQVGDGTAFWVYDVNGRNFSVTPYGRYDGNYAGTDTATTYRKYFVDAMTNASGSEASFLTRLLREVVAGESASYRTWLPGADPTDGPVDPNDVVYATGSPLTRQVTFDIDLDTDSNPHFKGIDYYDLKKVGSQDRETVWRIDVMDATTPPAELTLLPYDKSQIPGYRQVSRPRPVGQ